MKCLAIMLGCATLAASGETASLVLRGGKVVTLEAASPQVEALAIRGETIVALGTNRQINAYVGPSTKVIELGGRLAIPGFIEGHGHFMGIGSTKLNLNLRDARNWDEIVRMVAAAAREARPGAWIVGGGWHQSKWDRTPQPNVDGFPVHDALSKASPRNPVMLFHASGHAVMANALALKLAGITRDTPDPEGGHILKDGRGNPTGVLQERAQAAVTAAYDAWHRTLPAAEKNAEQRREVELAEQDCVAKGITTFEDAGSPLDTIDMFHRLADEGKLDLRLWVMVRAPTPVLAKRLDEYKILNAGDHHLTVRAIKRYMDGALGSRGAWLLAPYSDLPPDAPNRSGLNVEDIGDIRKTAELAIAHGFQLCIHAIGDRANRETLNLYESVFREHPEKTKLRWRVEHAQQLDPADIPRFAALGVIASMQAIHCTSDAPFVIARLGFARAQAGAYVWRKLIDSGAVVTNGTDAPVEDVDPIACYYAAVTRRAKDGSVFFPEERMTRIEALRSYTVNNAYAAFEERMKGTLAVGKLADITVLSKDILTVPDEEIPAARVVATIVGGKVVYRGTMEIIQ
ncbi:MAG: amidohydrolase [Bryobacteraceae bacterium]